MTEIMNDIYRIDRFNWSKLDEVLLEVSKAMNCDRSAIIQKYYESHCGEKENIMYWIDGKSTFGIIVRRYNNFIIVESSIFSNETDINLLLMFLDATKRIMAHSNIQFPAPDNAKPGMNCVSLDDILRSHYQRIGHLLLKQTINVDMLDGTKRILDSNIKDLTMSLPGYKRHLAVSPVRIQEQFQDKTPQDVGEYIINKLFEIQNLDASLLEPASLKMMVMGKKEAQSCRIIDNQADYFIAETPYLLLVCGNITYTVQTYDFLCQFEDNESIQLVDHAQFIIRKQSPEIWQKICHSLKRAEPLVHADTTIHLFKWEPSPTLSVPMMQKMIRTTPKGASLQIVMNAEGDNMVKDNDLAVLLRVGSGTTGLVGVGFTATNDKDVKASGNVFINFIRVSDPARPYCSLQHLKKMIPSVNWESTENDRFTLSPECATIMRMLLQGIKM